MVIHKVASTSLMATLPFERAKKVIEFDDRPVYALLRNPIKRFASGLSFLRNHFFNFYASDGEIVIDKDTTPEMMINYIEGHGVNRDRHFNHQHAYFPDREVTAYKLEGDAWHDLIDLPRYNESPIIDIDPETEARVLAYYHKDFQIWEKAV